MEFYLGCHLPNWLNKFPYPLFVSRTTLRRRKKFPVANISWCLDSGAFTEIATHGKWTISEGEYASFINRCSDEIGNLVWAAPQDWMCEPDMLDKTGLTIKEHQYRTIESYLKLRDLTETPVIPVLQGWDLENYLDHIEQYSQAGVDLKSMDTVGLGSVCRRQDTRYAESIVAYLSQLGLSLHAFGFKLTGLKTTGHLLKSADSMAWSYNARKNPPIEGHSHKSCGDCMEWALRWREKAMRAIARSHAAQLPMLV